MAQAASYRAYRWAAWAWQANARPIMTMKHRHAPATSRSFAAIEDLPVAIFDPSSPPQGTVGFSRQANAAGSGSRLCLLLCTCLTHTCLLRSVEVFKLQSLSTRDIERAV